MKTKIILTIALFMGLIKTLAQSYEQQYILEEQTRLNQVQIIESEILTFINNNINSYDFTQIVNTINNVKDEEGNYLTGNAYQEELVRAKKQLLRDVYFQKKPEKLKYFYATDLKQQCVNGGFETATTAGFSFSSNKYYSNYFAFTINPTSVISASPTSKATIVDSSIPDPVVGISRVKTGIYAIRLNNTDESFDPTTISNNYRHVTKMTKQFIVNEKNISYAFALVLQNGGHVSDNQNPYYQVKLINNDNNNQIVFQRNVMANPGNPLFQESGDKLFTNWLCERIDTSNLIGNTVTLEIILGDCGQGGHYGYAYFDDFCGLDNCSTSSFNPSITLNPIKDRNCPSFPFPVTGNITIPSNANLSNIILLVKDALTNTVISSQTITTAPGGNFSFNLTNSSFYPNGVSNILNFNVSAQLNYTINGIPQNTLVTINTNPPGPDITFKDCPIQCQEFWQFFINQPIQTSESFYAFGSIYSESAIYPNIDVVFKAAYDIQLTPGFYTTSYQSGSFHAYIAPCEENSRYSTIKPSHSKVTRNSYYDSYLQIYPNPTSTFINIDSGNKKITSWELLDISGRSVLKGSSNQVNIQGLPKTTYLLNINTNNRIITKKVIVN